MPKRRVDDTPSPTLPIWKKDGKLWRVEKLDLIEAINASPNSELEMKERMGKGYSRIADALSGQALDIWGVKHVEWGILKK